MRQAESNCSLKKVDLSFPYLQVLMQGKPVHGEDCLKHPPMDRVHRAKIFAPFDALDGFSALIRQQDCLREEPAQEKTEENICEFWEEP